VPDVPGDRRRPRPVLRPHPQGEPVQLRHRPLEIDAETYEQIEQGDDIEIVTDVAEAIASGEEEFTIRVNDDWEASATLDASDRERRFLADGGKLTHTKQQYESGSGATPADD